MRKEKSEFGKLIGGIIVLMNIIILFTACTGNSDKTVLDDSELDIEQLTEEQDRIAEGYKLMSFQTPTEQIISDYHEKGYEAVWLTSHEVEQKEGKIGEIGTTDSIKMQVTYADPGGYYQITEEVTALYAWWGEKIGWKNNYDVGTLISCDMSGFNETCWKLVSDSDIENGGYDYYNYDMATCFIGRDIMSQYDVHNSTVNIYFLLENFDIFPVEIEDIRYFNKLSFYGDIFEKNEVGMVTVVVEGDVYSTPLRLKYTSGGYDSSLLIGQGAEFYFCGAGQYDSCKGSYSVGGGSNMIPILPEEYEAALQEQEIPEASTDKGKNR